MDFAMDLSIMLTIIDEEHTEKVIRFLRDHLVRFQYVSQGFGTANSELMALLGLGETLKSIVISLLPKRRADMLSSDIPKHIKLGKRTKGLIITLPLTGISNSLFGSFNAGFLLKFFEELEPENRAHVYQMLKIEENTEVTADLLKERMLVQMENEPEKTQNQEDIVRHDLIMALVNQDTSEELMEVAKAAGAGGGTVINARRVGLDEDNTFMGMPIQVKKEIIMILTDRKNKMAIMKAINHDFGLSTPCHGLIFSIPVDSVAWIE